MEELTKANKSDNRNRLFHIFGIFAAIGLGLSTRYAQGGRKTKNSPANLRDKPANPLQIF